MTCCLQRRIEFPTTNGFKHKSRSCYWGVYTEGKGSIRPSTKQKQEILHILTITVGQITYVFALVIENSQILMFIRIFFQERRKFGYYFRFPSFCLLKEKPLDCFIIRKYKYIFFFSSSIFINFEEWNVDAFKRQRNMFSHDQLITF